MEENGGGLVPVKVVTVTTTAPSGQPGDGAAPAVSPLGPGQQQPESPAAPALTPGEMEEEASSGGAESSDVGDAASDDGKEPTEEEEEEKWEPLPSATTETPGDNSTGSTVTTAATTTPADGLTNMAAVEQELLEMQYRDGRVFPFRLSVARIQF